MTYEQRARLESAIERFARTSILEATFDQPEAKAQARLEIEDAWDEISKLLNGLEEETRAWDRMAQEELTWGNER